MTCSRPHHMRPPMMRPNHRYFVFQQPPVNIGATCSLPSIVRRQVWREAWRSWWRSLTMLWVDLRSQLGSWVNRGPCWKMGSVAGASTCFFMWDAFLKLTFIQDSHAVISIKFGQNVHKVLKKYGNSNINHLFIQNFVLYRWWQFRRWFVALRSMNTSFGKWS